MRGSNDGNLVRIFGEASTFDLMGKDIEFHQETVGENVQRSRGELNTIWTAIEGRDVGSAIETGPRHRTYSPLPTTSNEMWKRDGQWTRQIQSGQKIDQEGVRPHLCQQRNHVY